MLNKKHKILIAMSGGVDSSVAAALLVQEGYDVTGAFMINYDADQQIDCGSTDMADNDKRFGECWRGDYLDATRVAAKLGIPLLKLDFTKEYKKWVLDYMFAEYEKGRTPNPDVLCNKFIKFGVWLDKAKELGFDYLATGHYARLWREDSRDPLTPPAGGELPLIGGAVESARAIHLLQAKDKEKDQTYFLNQLNQEQLQNILFPIGEYTKSEVRELARKFDLPTAERAESMGICFVGEVPMKEFLMQKIKPKKGNIVTTTGVVIGEHDGLPFYTIGQRHLGVNSKQTTVNSKPLFVVEKRLDTNELVVGGENDPLLYKKEIKVKDVNWISGQTIQFPLKCKVRLRHRQELQKSNVRLLEPELNNGGHAISYKSKVLAQFEESQKAVTPGQFAVFYSAEECLGGGIIQ